MRYELRPIVGIITTATVCTVSVVAMCLGESMLTTADHAR